MDTKVRVTLVPPGRSKITVTMDDTDPRYGRLLGLGWYVVERSDVPAAPYGS